MSEADKQAQQLAEARRKLLAKRLSKKSKAVKPSSIPPKPSDTPSYASFGQQRLWYVHQTQPDSAAYHMVNVVRMRGELDTDALEQSLQAVIKHQDALRTTFSLEDGVVLQDVQVDAEISFVQEKLATNANIEAEIKNFATQSFDITQAPLLRAGVWIVDEQTYYLAIIIHHIIADEWSMDVLWREMATIYEAILNETEPNLSQLDIQYTDYAVWQGQQVADGKYDEQLSYWKERLGGDLPLLQLPTDYLRPNTQTYKGALLEETLGSSLSTAIQQMSQDAGTTLFTTLLAAYQVLLYRYTSQDDILVGTPVANRKQGQVEHLVGFFLNTVVQRADFNEQKTFREHLKITAQQSLMALANQDLPFDVLVDELNPKRDASYNPIFQTMFVYQDGNAYHPQLPNTSIEFLQFDIGVSKFDITLFARLEDDGIRLGIEFNTDLFEAATIKRLMQHYITLLESIIDSPDASVDTLNILPATEKAMLDSWNDTSQASQDDVLIHQLMTRHDEHAIVIKTLDAELTYGELTQRANFLAHQLIEIGVRANTAVGLCVERSPEMLVGILGILLAGGAYVPIDPAYPQERIDYILADAEIDGLVTQSHLLEALSNISSIQAVVLTEQTATTTPIISTMSDDLAYMIYTSGSTGQPKGVRVSHRNLVHSTTVRFEVYQHPVESFLLLSSFAFDSSLVGIFWTLCAGGILCLPPHNGERDVQQVAQLIHTFEITHLLALPSLYQILLEFADSEQLSSLNTVMVAGEASLLPLVKQHYEALPNALLYNEYGPTEGTVWATVWQVPPSAEKMRIGKPIPNMQVYIVDEQMTQVPIGVVGELVIAGAGITQGYHNRPELTAERFIENPFGEGKLYKTGDLGRYLADGTIEFIGRKDHQVKISGYRIELGEIESVLKSHTEVQDAIVMIIERESQKQIAAFITSQKSDLQSALLDYAQQRLPRYMLPNHLRVMADFPYMPNGKIDRRALEDSVEHRQQENTTSKIVDEIEIQIADIWESVLERSVPNADIDFFDLGGSSLQAIRMFAKLNQVLEKELPLALIMEAPTIAKLAAQIRSEDVSDKTLFTLQEGGNAAPLYLFQVNRFGIIHYQKLAQLLEDERPIYGLTLAEDDEADLPSLTEMAQQFADTILKQQSTEPYFLLGLSVAGVIAYEVGRILEQQGKANVHVIMFDTYGSDYPSYISTTDAIRQKLDVFTQQLMDGGEPSRQFLLRDGAWQLYYRYAFWRKKLLNRLRRRLNLPEVLDEEKDEFRVGGEAITEHVDSYFADERPSNISILLYRSQLQPLRADYSKTLHWDRYVPEKNITVKAVTGAHTNLLREGSVETIVAHMQDWLRSKDERSE